MARLNEPPAVAASATTTVINAAPPQESVDALKRRFVRQNRELAKNNSTQSLRIRALELEVSRLLGDNLGLREKVLVLKHELQQARRQAQKDGVRAFKEEMEAKIRALRDVVAGIEEEGADSNEEEEEDSLEAKKERALEGRELVRRQPLTEIMKDSQMPTIAEVGSSPRRTLDTEQIKAIRLSDQSSNESPDLGPPPVARLACQDPIKFDPQRNAPTGEPENVHGQEEEHLPANPSINLEPRRKRKESGIQIRRHSILPPQSPSSSDADVVAPTLRTGAKRKLADRDIERSAKPPAQSEFSFSRRNSHVEPTSIMADPVENMESKPVEEPALPIKPARRVLGEKSVNMSPRKPTVSEKAGKEDAKKLSAPRSEAAKERISSRRSATIAIPPPQIQHEVAVTSIEPPPAESRSRLELPPKTPAPPSIFSPTPSEASARPLADGKRDTPPPGDLSSLSITSNNIAADATRPSRRARAAVNYAEPSLIAKMRRPDKKMVDALTGLQDSRRAISTSAEKRPSANEGVHVNEEPCEEDERARENWQNVPEASVGSPLQDKGSSDPLTRSEHGDEEERPAVERQPSASSAAISVLMSSGTRGKRKTPTSSIREACQPLGPDIEAAIAKKLEELDLYDFKEESSPASSVEGPSSTTDARSRLGHRRHSSVPKEMMKPPASVAKKEEAEKPSVSARGTTAGVRSERAASRRRSMMV